MNNSHALCRCLPKPDNPPFHVLPHARIPSTTTHHSAAIVTFPIPPTRMDVNLDGRRRPPSPRFYPFRPPHGTSSQPTDWLTDGPNPKPPPAQIQIPDPDVNPPSVNAAFTSRTLPPVHIPLPPELPHRPGTV